MHLENPPSLTLALSQGERGPESHVVQRSLNSEAAGTWFFRLPLPLGEGRGEGPGRNQMHTYV
jgi:hypothetical protein